MFTVIVNPESGGGKAKKLLPEIESLLKNRSIEYSVRHTRYPLSKEQFADVPCGSSDTVAVAGGDGTVFDVLNNLPGLDMVLMYIPCGTGNDFVKTIGLPKDPIKALTRQLDGSIRALDLVKANDRLFINLCGTGFDCEVLKKLESLRSKYKGFRAYLASVGQSISAYKPLGCRVSIDGGKPLDGQYALISIGNGKYCGGGMKAVPAAVPDDGKLDAVLVRSIKKHQIYYLLPLFVLGLHTKLGFVETVRCSNIDIEFNGSATCQADGELFDTGKLSLRILPGAIRLKL